MLAATELMFVQCIYCTKTDHLRGEQAAWRKAVERESVCVCVCVCVCVWGKGEAGRQAGRWEAASDAVKRSWYWTVLRWIWTGTIWGTEEETKDSEWTTKHYTLYCINLSIVFWKYVGVVTYLKNMQLHVHNIRYSFWMEKRGWINHTSCFTFMREKASVMRTILSWSSYIRANTVRIQYVILFNNAFLLKSVISE